MDNPFYHHKDKKREYFQALITQLINNLDYLYQAYVLSDLDSREMFELISKSQTLYSNNLSLVQIMSEINEPVAEVSEEELLAFSNF